MTTYTIMSIGEIDIYLGFTNPAQPTIEVMTMAEEKSGSTLSVEAEEFKVSEKIKPAQPTPEVEEEVEEKSGSDLPDEIGYTDEEYIRYGSIVQDAVAGKNTLEAQDREDDEAPLHRLRSNLRHYGEL